MNRHPYLRAYMAGLLLPSWFLPVGIAGFTVLSHTHPLPDALQKMIVFPMAIVPNLWGLWNLLYLALGLKRRLPLGAWGALLPAILVPSGVALSHLFGMTGFTAGVALAVFPIAAAGYYLLWKHVVGFFNGVLGVNT